ncbi:MAG: DUF975 family protein [Oscillospiraceae bacterium]|nr:DUF975 family protein [Oscillospiraceae bacterium]
MFNVKQLKSKAKDQLRNSGSFDTIIVCGVIIFIFVVFSEGKLLLGSIKISKTYSFEGVVKKFSIFAEKNKFIMLAMFFASVFILPALEMALTKICFLLCKGQKKLKIKDFVYAFKELWVKSVSLHILRCLFLILWSILIIPGIIKFFSYSLAPYVLCDEPNLTAMEALSKSKNLTKGRKLIILKIYFSFFWWYFLNFFTYSVFAIWTAPYFNSVFVNFYESIKKNNEKQ